MKGPILNPFLLLLVLFCVSCGRKKIQITRSCYYWASSDYLDPSQKEFLKKHAVTKVYARLMDVDWKETYGAYPVATNSVERLSVHLNDNDSFPINTVPVVFITNKTFLRINKAAIPLLAKRIARRCLPGYDGIDREYESDYSYNFNLPNGKRFVPQEIQFDCDWTPTSAANYFYFLQVFKSLLPDSAVRVSATVRLHQYKYPEKTGIPPVDRGMLMIYNMQDLRQYTAANSIFDAEKARAYFGSGMYPLPLDFVLPAYSWCIVFRNKEFLQIEYSMQEEELRSAGFLQPAGSNFYRVQKDTVFHDLFLRVGDEIKLEKIDDETLEQAARLAEKAFNSDSCSMALFELSSPQIEKYQYETVEKAYTADR